MKREDILIIEQKLSAASQILRYIDKVDDVLSTARQMSNPDFAICLGDSDTYLSVPSSCNDSIMSVLVEMRLTYERELAKL